MNEADVAFEKIVRRRRALKETLGPEYFRLMSDAKALVWATTKDDSLESCIRASLLLARQAATDGRPGAVLRSHLLACAPLEIADDGGRLSNATIGLQHEFMTMTQVPTFSGNADSFTHTRKGRPW
ncbi:MAG: hypothetical protein EPN91_02350 [Salinibacterium sp.]|nr:MAG: hypothetical protein EPN91_02350 [Salinibacterium sp.]